MPYTSISILNPNSEIINYIDNVNYGVSKPQFNHLSSLMHGLINVHGNKSISSIAESVLSAKDRSCIYKFLSQSRWDDSLLDINKSFKSKMQLAQELISSFVKPSNCHKVYALTDSWYTNGTIINECLKSGYHLIGAVKSNRIIAPKGIKIQLSQFTQHINPDELDVVTVKGKDYRIFVYEGSVSKVENAKILICYEVEDQKLKPPVYLMSTDIELDAEAVISYYLHRWSIETNYKYLKSNLGFDKYRVRRIISIERYFLIVFLAVNFLEIFRVSQRNLMLKNISEAIRYQNNLTVKELISFVYSKAKENVPVNNIYSELNIAQVV